MDEVSIPFDSNLIHPIDCHERCKTGSLRASELTK